MRLTLLILVACLAASTSSELARTQDLVRPKDIVTRILLGRWIQTATGNLLDMRSNGDIEVDSSGLSVKLRETGTYASCSADDANVCLSTPSLNCAFRYRVGSELYLYLQYRSGGEACVALRGQYQRQQPN